MVTQGDALTKLTPDELQALAEKILAGLDFSEWADLVPDLQELILAVTEDGILAGFGQIGATPTDAITEQVNEHALAFARDRAAELVGKRYNADGELVDNPNAEWAITDSTREMLRSDVARVIELGTSSEDFAAQLEDSYAFSADRASTIARTELARADVEGNLMSYKASGIVRGKISVLGSEHDTDDECDEAAAMGEVDLDDDFGGAGDAPYHPGCECDVLPVLDDEEE